MRMRKTLPLLILLLLPLPALAEHPRCLKDAMGQTFCARTERGVAVKSGLGEIVCARGDCVQEEGGTEWSRGDCVQEEGGTEWYCSRTGAGWARLGPDGPECEEGCYTPTETECKRM
jgi:hypothetical protein